MKGNNNASDTALLVTRLFDAGAHFGFSRRRRHPSVVPYLFGNKHGTDIFDLEKTSALLVAAQEVLHEAGSARKTVLFVGTKTEVARLVRTAALGISMPYVTTRWIGGTLTNFPEMQKRITRLGALDEQRASGELEQKYTKKERVMLAREHEKLSYNFEGIRTLEKLPDMLVVVDPRHDQIAVREAKQVHIPVIGVTSSDGDVRALTHPVLVNDALHSSVSLVLEALTVSYKRGQEAAEESTPAFPPQQQP